MERSRCWGTINELGSAHRARVRYAYGVRAPRPQAPVGGSWSLRPGHRGVRTPGAPAAELWTGGARVMASSFTILRLRGIPIGVHWSWLIIFGIFVWSLTKVLYPAAYPGLDGATYLGMGIATALLFFGSVLLHELSHALLSEREGIHIEGIS